MSQTDVKTAPLESEAIHRRETIRQIVLPIGGGIVVLALLLIGAMLTPALVNRPEQIAMLANTFAILSLIIPMILCFLPFYILLMVLAFGVGAFNNATAFQLRRLNRLSRTITDKTISASEVIDRQTVNLRVKIAGVENAMENAFKVDEKHDSTDDESTRSQE